VTVCGAALLGGAAAWPLAAPAQSSKSLAFISHHRGAVLEPDVVEESTVHNDPRLLEGGLSKEYYD
jgi:hypothetical protein